MAIGDYQDDQGNNIPPPEPPDSAPSGGASASQRQQIIDGIIIPDFTKIAKRPPSQSEIDEAYDVYARFGGDIFRSKVQERFPAASGGAAGGFTWPPGSDFGAPPDPYGEAYSAGSYTPPEFQEKFEAPTAESLTSDPGYQSRMQAGQRGFERSAAARGSLLSGGFVGRTLPRALGELASNEYGQAFGRAFDTYQQRYGQFSDSAARGADAFKTNEMGKLNQFQTRYNSYQDLVKNRRQSEEDRFRRELDLARLGLDAASSGAPR
jgi:hypothetical protein